jgi:hypothetical protein
MPVRSSFLTETMNFIEQIPALGGTHRSRYMSTWVTGTNIKSRCTCRKLGRVPQYGTLHCPTPWPRPPVILDPAEGDVGEDEL